MSSQLHFRGTLEGHSGWVTSIATSVENPDLLVSGSRGAYLDDAKLEGWRDGLGWTCLPKTRQERDASA
ncbi:cross-pathway control WD-repeat protein cpc2 [Rhizoclosmatium sp. JEL0117]|nr:cross-pathway control WD-repeat protein cpc2 [Rhizoclosmatium sp. JEL0117]